MVAKIQKKLFMLVQLILILLTINCKIENGFKKVKVSGNKLVDTDGNEIILHGINLGGISTIEPWMNPFKSSDSANQYGFIPRDSYGYLNTLIKRFGKEKTKELLHVWRNTWITENDFVRIKDAGFNMVRFPFSYFDLDFDAVTISNYEASILDKPRIYDFTFIDKIIGLAEKYNFYLVLDLHGTYGSHNGQDHGGYVLERNQLDFYSNNIKKKLTNNLWKALAERYKNNNVVVAFEILNEPTYKGEWASKSSVKNQYFNYFDELYKVLREVDKEKPIILAACWRSSDLPNPKNKNWINVIYTYHHYSGLWEEKKREKHKKTFVGLISDVKKANYNIPTFLGEFTNYGYSGHWEDAMPLIKEAKWSWCTWSYKIFPKSRMGGWGMIHRIVDNNLLIDITNDNIALITSKMRTFVTKDNDLSTMDDSNTKIYFVDLLKKYNKY